MQQPSILLVVMILIGMRQRNMSHGRLSPTRRSPCMWQRGFTLIEILVVLFIISIIAGVTVFSIQHNRGKQLDHFAKELTQLVTFAAEQAMLRPAVLGVHFTNSTFQFSTFEPTYDLATKAKIKQTWLPLQDKILKPHAIPTGIEVALEVNHTRADLQKQIPQIVISANGDMTPFTIFISRAGQQPLYAITGSPDGSITQQLLSTNSTLS